MSAELTTFKVAYKFDDEDWIVLDNGLNDNINKELVTYISIDNCIDSITRNITSLKTILNNILDAHIRGLRKEVKKILMKKFNVVDNKQLIVCDYCGTYNRTGDKFCRNCGARYIISPNNMMYSEGKNE